MAVLGGALAARSLVRYIPAPSLDSSHWASVGLCILAVISVLPVPEMQEEDRSDHKQDDPLSVLRLGTRNQRGHNKLVHTYFVIVERRVTIPSQPLSRDNGRS